MPKNLLLTEVLYAGGAVQEYVVIQPQTLTGWNGADAEGEPPVPPYCPPDPNTDQGPPPQEPPCVDVAGECIPIGKSEFTAICGYKYIDLDTGEIFELSSDTQYPLIDPNSHQWIKCEQPGAVAMRDPDTGDTTTVQQPFARGKCRTITLTDEQYEDGYDKHWDEVRKVWSVQQTMDYLRLAPQGVIEFNNDGTENTNFKYANWVTIPSQYNITGSIVWQYLYSQNLTQFTAAGASGAYPSQDYKKWSLCGTVYEGSEVYGITAGIGQYPLAPNSDPCLDCETQFIVGAGNDKRCHAVNIVMANLPVSDNWMGFNYPTSPMTSFSWQSYSALTSWARRAASTTEHEGWPCAANCKNGTPFEGWPCNCPGYGDPEDPNSAENCVWYSYNWEWDDSLVPAFGFDGWNPMGPGRKTVQSEVNYWLNINGARWGGTAAKQGGWGFKKITDCEWRIVEVVNTRNLPSAADIEGTVQYTYDADGNAYPWIWSNADGWQSYGSHNYDGGDI